MDLWRQRWSKKYSEPNRVKFYSVEASVEKRYMFMKTNQNVAFAPLLLVKIVLKSFTASASNLLFNWVTVLSRGVVWAFYQHP